MPTCHGLGKRHRELETSSVIVEILLSYLIIIIINYFEYVSFLPRLARVGQLPQGKTSITREGKHHSEHFL